MRREREERKNERRIKEGGNKRGRRIREREREERERTGKRSLITRTHQLQTSLASLLPTMTTKKHCSY